MSGRESSWVTESEPTHMEDLMVITRALTAANLVLIGQKPPAKHWELTPELIEQAHRACLSIQQCRRRTFFR